MFSRISSVITLCQLLAYFFFVLCVFSIFPILLIRDSFKDENFSTISMLFFCVVESTWTCSVFYHIYLRLFIHYNYILHCIIIYSYMLYKCILYYLVIVTCAFPYYLLYNYAYICCNHVVLCIYSKKTKKVQCITFFLPTSNLKDSFLSFYFLVVLLFLDNSHNFPALYLCVI